MEERGLVEIRKGWKARGYDRGFCSVLTSTESMDNLLKGIVLKPVRADPEIHPVMTHERSPVGREFLENHDYSLFGNTVLTREYMLEDYERVERLNRDYFPGMFLGFEDGAIVNTDGMTFEDVRELMKNEGNVAALNMATNVFFTAMFSYDGGGRLYQRCDSFQNIKKGMRGFLTINGNGTRQADYSGMHVNMLYFLKGQENPFFEDPYFPVLNDLGLPDDCRKAVKKCAIVSLNTADYREYARAMAGNHMREVQLLIRNGARLRDVYGSMMRIYGKDNEDFFERNPSKPAVIMFHESRILKDVIDELCEREIKAVPLHDAVIYDEDHHGEVEEIMREKYRAATGNDIMVKTT
jgi:hypothetical protein